MSLNLQLKQAVVAEVAKEIAGAQAIVMVENRGMVVADMTKLRAKARDAGVYFRVMKNTLVRRAVADTPFAALSGKMVGPLLADPGSTLWHILQGDRLYWNGHSTPLLD